MAIASLYMAESIVLIVLLGLLHHMLRAIPAKRERLKERLPFFDAAKGLAIIFIIAIHATDLVPRFQWVLDYLWIALPFFIIVSGYLLMARYGDAPNLSRFYNSAFSRIVIIYLLFVAAIGVIKTRGFSPAGFAIDALLGRTNGNYYFIPLLLSLYLLYPVLARLLRFRWRFVIAAAVMFASYAFFLLNYYVQQPEWNSNPVMLAFFARFLFFFYAGMLLAGVDIKGIRFSELKFIVPAYAIAAVSVSIWVHKPYLLYFSPIIAVLLLIAADNALGWKWPTFEKLGQCSFVIYLAHTRFMYDWIKPLLPSITISGAPLYACIVVVTLAISFLFSIAFMAIYRAVEAAVLHRVRGAPAR